MPHDVLVVYGHYIGLALIALPIILFLCMMFVFRPAELNQFDFQKRLQLSFTSMQGEHNFFSKQGLKKLKTFRRMWVVLIVLIALRFAFGIWLSELGPVE
jgi:hypothetical protein